MEERLYGVAGVECRIIVAGPSRGPGVLLLHGYSFTGKTWVEVGAVEYLAGEGFRVIAPDMPYGRSASCTKRTRSIDLNVAMVKSIVSIMSPDEFILVGASLGGKIAAYYSVLEKMPKGLVLVAPAIREKDRIADKLRLLRRIPVVVMWGTRDRIVSRRVVEWVVEETGGKLIVYEGAGHALYLDQPERFNRDLAGIAKELLVDGA